MPFTITNNHTEAVRWGNKSISAGDTYTITSADTLAGIGVMGDPIGFLEASEAIKLSYIVIDEDGDDLTTEEALDFLDQCHKSGNLVDRSFYDQLLFNDSVTPTADKTIASFTKILVLGASIMYETFVNTTAARDEFIAAGFPNTITFDQEAVGGWTIANLYDNLDNILTDHLADADTTLLIVHCGGNDVSFSGGYPNRAETMRSDYRRLILRLQGLGFTVVPSSISYRIPPASNPSDPFNRFLFDTVWNRYCPEFMNGGRPALDLYQATFDNQATWFHTDNIHMNATGEAGIRTYFAQQLFAQLNRTLEEAPVEVAVVGPTLGTTSISYDYQGSGFILLNDITTAGSASVNWNTINITNNSDAAISFNAPTSRLDIDFGSSSFSGDTSITFTVEGSDGGISNTGTVNITVAQQAATPPVPTSSTILLQTEYQGVETIDLATIFTAGTSVIDWSTTVVTSRQAGVVTSMNGSVLTIDYSGTTFDGIGTVDLTVAGVDGARSVSKDINVNVAEEVIAPPDTPPTQDTDTPPIEFTHNVELSVDLSPYVSAGTNAIDWNTVQPVDSDDFQMQPSAPDSSTWLITHTGFDFEFAPTELFTVADTSLNRSQPISVVIQATGNPAPQGGDPNDRVVINFGVPSNADFGNNVAPDDGSYSGFNTVGGASVNGGITITGVGGQVGGSGRAGTQGPTETVMDIQHNDLPQTFFYVTTNTVQITPDNTLIDTSANYEVQTISSRNTTATDRESIITVGTTSRTVAAHLNPPQTETWVVSGADLVAQGITVERNTGSSFGYINGVSFLKL